MDSVEVVVVASPFANLAPLYEVDPDADALLVVSPSNRQTRPQQGANGTATAPSEQGLRIKVSSKHLALASRVFRNKLQFGSTKPARQADGRVHLRLAEGFSAKAVSIVANALHGRGSKVPKAVDLDTLAQIALFVDRFQLLDAVEVYADRWISRLELDAPGTVASAPVPWIYVGYVFRRADLFKEATKHAAAQASGPIETGGLPIKAKIIQHIESQRQALLAEAITNLHTTVDNLASGNASCKSATTPQSCDALLLGSVIQSLHTRRLAWPRPAAPFTNLAFGDVVQAVREGVAGHHRQRQAEREKVREEAEPWYLRTNGAVKEERNGDGSSGGTGRAKKEGVVNGAGEEGTGLGFPITPAASPEPVYRNGGGRFEGRGHVRVHACEVDRVVAGLEGLERLGDAVEGLVLEGRLGYLAY
ncbi:uncharacterized protein C8A04DRAFT_28331 [Dichotomopilus funicola]|uniref:BTB domain-containing protein n=1 Tax=Dichotomopilus funicola TaxID=1934379 RepID=A0AAN6V373_9PEZI|nr:hypothetical protein C8A04DRAFT_28331 [Dichotomopilus funicola]